MHPTILMLAASVAQVPVCPSVQDMSRSTPVAMRVARTLPGPIADRGVVLQKGDVLGATSPVAIDEVATTFHVLRSAGRPGIARIFALCLAPWSKYEWMLCASMETRSTQNAPDVFVRKIGERPFLVVRRQERSGRSYEGWNLDHMTGFRKVCGGTDGKRRG